MTDVDDLGLSQEDFTKMVQTLVESFSLLRWKWLGGEGKMKCSAVQCSAVQCSAVCNVKL